MSGQATRGFAPVVRTSSPPPTNHSALLYKYSAPLAHECVILSGLGCTQAAYQGSVWLSLCIALIRAGLQMSADSRQQPETAFTMQQRQVKSGRWSHFKYLLGGACMSIQSTAKTVNFTFKIFITTLNLEILLKFSEYFQKC